MLTHRDTYPSPLQVEHSTFFPHRTCAALCEAMERFALAGEAYPSMIDPDAGTDGLVASYGPEGYARLQRVKARYDPENVFRSNKAIEPAR